MQKEMGQLQSEMNRIADTTSFGGQNLLDGSFGDKNGETKFQIGANSNETQSLGLMDVSSHALGRSYSGVQDATAAKTNKLTGGSSTSDSGFTINAGGKEHSIDVTKDMSAEDLEHKINNIDGLSDVKVTTAKQGIDGKDAVQATQTLSGISTTGTGDLTLSIAAKNVTIKKGDSNQDIADTINNSADLQKLGVSAALDKNGNITVSGNEDGSDLEIKAAYAADSKGSSITIGSTTVDGNTTAVTATGETASNGSAAVVEQAAEFNIDFSKVKVDKGISTLSLGGKGMAAAKDLAVNTSKVTTESVASLDLSTQDGAQNAIDVLDAAMEQVDSKRAEIGAFQNRMNHTMSNLANINENVNASNSRIKDVD
ncbi:flagellin, partial [Psychrobacter sp. Ps6]